MRIGSFRLKNHIHAIIKSLSQLFFGVIPLVLIAFLSLGFFAPIIIVSPNFTSLSYQYDIHLCYVYKPLKLYFFSKIL